MLFLKLIFTTVIFHISNASEIFYTMFNATDKFAEFKKTYNKVYNTSDEAKKRFMSFVTNLNSVSVLNANPNNSDTIYVINKYADLDPAEVEDRYAINLKTYDKVKDGDYKDLLKSNQGIEINNNNLYDLYNAKQLFEKYKKEQNRQFKDKREGFLHFYRFVKTLVEDNRSAYEGDDNHELNDKADILKESHEFFY